MSVEELSVVLQHAPFTGRDKLILVGIANHAGDGGAWPAISTLARYANCSASSAKRSLKVLEDAGAIVKHVQAGGMANKPDWARPNLYEIKVECPPNCSKTAKHEPVDKELPPESMLWINRGSTLDRGSGREPRGGSGREPRGGSGREPLTIKEPPMNQIEKSPFASTSPGTPKTCWSCGQPKCITGSYCPDCSNRGFDTPIINCRHCNTTARRGYPGQRWFYCPEHKHLQDEFRKNNHEGATS